MGHKQNNTLSLSEISVCASKLLFLLASKKIFSKSVTEGGEGGVGWGGAAQIQSPSDGTQFQTVSVSSTSYM